MSQNIRVTKSFTFDMAHALYGYDGSCKNIHGHTYHLFVTLLGKPIYDTKSPKAGMVLDFKDLKMLVKNTVIDDFDHALVLNKNSPHRELESVLTGQFEKVIFLDKQPTCENILLHIKNLLINTFPGDHKVVCLKLMETPDSYAEWHLGDNLD